MKALVFIRAASASVLLFSPIARAEIRFDEPPRAVCAASDVAVSYVISGLGNRLSVDTFTSADVTLECVTANHRTLVETRRMTTPATHPVDRNGIARGSVFLRPFNPCAGSERLVATYRGIAIEVGNQEAITVVPGSVVCRP